MTLFRDNTGWRENIGSNRFKKAVEDDKFIREHEARAIYGNKIINKIIEMFPVEYHHNEIGDKEYFFEKKEIDFFVKFVEKKLKKEKKVKEKIKELRKNGLKVTSSYKTAKKYNIIKVLKYDSDKDEFLENKNILMSDIYIYTK